jgi:hypothetical protein
MEYLWVGVVLFAAAAQTVRNTAQRSLTAQVGTLPATLVRFLYGLPFAAIYLLALYVWAIRPWCCRSSAPPIWAGLRLVPSFRSRPRLPCSWP